MTTILDARGLNCPLPVLKANKALKAMAAGETLTVLASDPAAPKDFEAFCSATGHRLIAIEHRDGEFVIAVRKAAAAS
ncbi:MAG: sulfurtransferase TusA family protein [Rhodospirillales bacterium]|nr:sulfurtransferase TusA family protein [Rhodospirillales bacterium]